MIGLLRDLENGQKQLTEHKNIQRLRVGQGMLYLKTLVIGFLGTAKIYLVTKVKTLQWEFG